MADSPISSLPAVENLPNGQPNIETDDLFVLEHPIDGQRRACKVSGDQVTKFISRNVVAYDGSIVASNAAGGANYNPNTQTLTLVLPHGPGFETVVPGASRAAREEEVATLEGTVTTYDLMSEEVRLTNPDSTIPSHKIGEIQVYNGRNGTGLINSVMNVGPTAGTTNVPAEKLFNLIYPVGSVYISTVLINPDTIFGGTWERIQDTFLMAAGTNHSAGTTHTNNENISLNKNQLPNEQLGIGFKYNLDGSGNLIATNTDGSENCPPKFKTAYNGNHSLYPGMYYDVGRFWPSDSTHKTSVFGLQYYDATSPGIYREPATLQTESINGGVTQQTIDIAPTYLTVYMWKRTALAT